MSLKKSALTAALAMMALASSLAAPATAEARARWHGDIRYFHHYDIGFWRGGHWFHGPHDGRPGWWWIVGGSWYFFPRPVYPFPDPYVPSAVVIAPQAMPPQAAMPPQPVAPPPVVAAQSWYYCSNPPGYYPYVANCAGPWAQVPANPGR